MEFHGEEAVASALRAMVPQQQAAARRAVVKAAHYVEAKTKAKLSLTSHPKGTPTPSLPGQPPSLVTGTLKRSVKTTGARRTARGYEALVGPTAEYARVQELGGPAGRGLRTRLPARPYLRPALRESRPGIRAIFGREWRL